MKEESTNWKGRNRVISPKSISINQVAGWREMAGTSDGISELEWDRVHEICIQITEAVDSDDDLLESSKKKELLEYLAGLEKIYGERPSILATRADYVDEVKSKIVLLQKAFEMAKTISDFRNLTLISSSLAQTYIEESNNPREGKKWLSELERSLKSHWDSGEAEELQRLSRLVRG